MRFGRLLGFRGDFEKRFAERDPKAVELFESMEAVKNEAAEFMKVRATWQFFEAESEGNALHISAPGAAAPLHTFQFKRQRLGDFLCLSDYILAPQAGKRDHLALFVVTAGEGVRERGEKAKNDGFYFKSHGLQALAMESAEACAEGLHRRLRDSGARNRAAWAGRARRGSAERPRCGRGTRRAARPRQLRGWSGAAAPGAKMWSALPSDSASKNCQVARTFMNSAASFFTASIDSNSSTALGSRSAKRFSKSPRKPRWRPKSMKGLM